MRGRPQPPDDVVAIQAIWQNGEEKQVTNLFHVFAPGSWTATPAQLNVLLGDFFEGPCQDLLSVLPTPTFLGVLRLSTFGTSPLTIQYQPASNVGAIGGSTPPNCSAGLTWRTGERNAAMLGHTFLPLSNEFVGEDHSRLKSVSWSQLQSAARNFVDHVNEIGSPDGGLCVFVVVHVSRGGQPLGFARMAPVEFGDASP